MVKNNNGVKEEPRMVDYEDRWAVNPWDALEPGSEFLLGASSDARERDSRREMASSVVTAAGDNYKAKVGWQEMETPKQKELAFMLNSTSESLAKGSGDMLNMMAWMNVQSLAQGAMRAAYAAKHGKTGLGRKMAARRLERKSNAIEDAYLKYGGTGQATALTLKR